MLAFSVLYQSFMYATKTCLPLLSGSLPFSYNFDL